MRLDILDLGTENTACRVTLNYDECMLLMQAASALRDARYPGLLSKLPQMFDEEDVARVLGSAQDANDALAVFELEQAFHQALHLFPGGHDHGHDDEDGH